MEGDELRPLSLGELLDRSFGLYRKYFLLFLAISIPPQLFFLAATVVRGAGVFLHASPVITARLVLPLSLLAVLIGFLTQGAVTFAVAEVHLGRAVSFSGAYSRIWKKLWRLIAAVMLFGLAVGGGTILLLIPGIWAFLRGILVVPVTVLEDLKARAALRKSIALTKGAAGRISVVMLFSFILALIAQMIFQFPLAFLLSKPWSEIFGSIGGVIAGLLVGPIWSIVLCLLYFDQRVRMEAFDLQMMLGALDGPKPDPAVPQVLNQ